MAGKHKFTRAYKGLDIQKANELNPIPGILGFIINGNRTVEVPNRNGYVYVRLRDNLSEVCQAFNDNVSPVYGLPVLMVRDSTNRTRYKILGRDLGRYQDWGTSSPYLPRHGAQHSFNPPNEGGDVTWIYSRQLMPLSVYPSGSYGAGNVLIYPHTFYRNNTWHYAGGTGTASFLPYKPTGSSARMVLLYIDDNDAPAYVAGSFFNSTYTGTVQILPYVPSLPTTSGIPLAGIRLVSGTSVILWDNIYDLRPFIVGDGFIPTGTSGGHIIADEGVSLPAQPILDFLGPGVGVRDVSGRTEVIISGTSTGGGSLPDKEVGFGNGSSIVSSSRFTFDSSTDSLTIGNTSPYTSALLSVFGDDVVGNYPYLDIFGLGTGYVPTLETYHAKGTYAVRQPALANEQLSTLDFYGYATGSGNYWLRGVSLEVFAQYDWHVVGGNSYSPAFLRLSAGSTGTSGLTVIGTFDVEKVKLSGDLNVSGTMRPGAFQLRNGATNGYILTSDANGIGTWQPNSGTGTSSSSSLELIVNEDKSSGCNGATFQFSTSNTFQAGSTLVTLNGISQRPGTGSSYVEDVGYSSITFATAPITGDELLITYVKSGTGASTSTPTSIYIATTGSDTTGNGTVGSPYATMAKALSVLPDHLYSSCTIYVADGTYAEGIDIRRFRCQSPIKLTITGNTTTPANVVFTGVINSTACVYVSGVVEVETEGIKVNATATAGMYSTDNALLEVDRCEVTGTLTHGIYAYDHGRIRLHGNLSISGHSGAGIAGVEYSDIRYKTVGTATIVGNSSTSEGASVSYHSSFMVECQATLNITEVKTGGAASLCSVWQHWGQGGGTITIDNVSTPSNSNGFYSGDASTVSTDRTVTLDHLTTGFQSICVSYLEASGTRNLTNVGSASSTSLGGVVYLP